jgi:hypothetical protein
MAISINWGTSVIFVPRNDLILIQSTPTEIRQLNINDFRLALKDLEDSTEGMPFPDTHNHVAPISVGGVDLARVIEILEPYTVTFEDGQYAVNLVGANSNIGDRTNVNQVSVRSANSAGLPDIEAIQAASYNGLVTVRSDSIYSGITYPVGTNSYPVNNIPDARAIAARQGLNGLKIIGQYTLDTGDDISNFSVYGINAMNTQIVINPGANTLNAQIVDAYVTGNLDGGALLERCMVDNLNYINGVIYNCMLQPGTISLGGTNPAYFLNCYSGVPGQMTPEIDMNGTGNEDTPLVMRNYAGGILLKQKTGPGLVSIDLGSGQVKIDPTCVNGAITVRGDGKVITTSGVHIDTGIINGNLQVYNEANYGGHIHDIWKDMGLNPGSPSAKVLANLVKDEVWNAQTTSHIASGSFGAFIQSKLLTVAKYLGLK